MRQMAEWNEVGAEALQEIRAAHRPAILRGLVARWPAVAEAQRSPGALGAYLKRFAGTTPVDALVGPPEIGGYLFYRDDMTDLNFSRHKQQLAQVLEALVALVGDSRPPAISVQSVKVTESVPGFLAENPLPLLPDVVPRIWIGNRITVAPHFDLYENIACVVAGRRRFTAFPPDQLPNLYVGPFDFSPAGAPVSMVDPRAPDFDRYPRYREALDHAYVGEIEAGDAIYLPYMWWHGVESLAPFNMLVNYWWNEARPATSPFDLLMHALLVLGDMPDKHRAVWRGMLEHFVFRTNGDPLAHLEPGHRGALGGQTPEQAKAIRASLARNLTRF